MEPININTSNLNTIYECLKYRKKKHVRPVIYKQTSRRFKSKHGIDLHNAPMVFVKHGTIWLLYYSTYISKKHVYEEAKYLPIVATSNKTFGILHNEIITPWDK